MPLPVLFKTSLATEMSYDKTMLHCTVMTFTHEKILDNPADRQRILRTGWIVDVMATNPSGKISKFHKSPEMFT